MRVRLLNCLASALVKHGGQFLFSLAPGGEVIYKIAAEAWDAYCTTDKADSVRAELEALAQASADQVRQVVAEAVKEVAAGHSAKVQEVLCTYLNQVPASIRRTMRRPSDPSGKSVPAGVAVRGAEDLAAFLPARMPRFKPGDRPLPGVDWELEELAGVGGFGEVWKARHAYLKSKPPVALKFCLDSSATAALRNEAGVLDRVMQHGKHGGIVPLLHTYLSGDPPCLEYEFFEGGDLTGLIQEMHAHGRVKPEVANRLLLRLAEIVAFAHKAEPPIVHGDLKPANVLARRTADGKVALRVVDFGIGGIAAARAAQEVRQPTRSRPQLLTEAVRGAHTPLYASPEQMARRPGTLADPRDDVHALGVIWFQLITGELAMTSIPPDWREQLAERGVGENLIRLVGACVAPKADKRPASAVVLVEQINAANVPMLELIDADAAGPGKAEKPRAAVLKTATPDKTRGASPVVWGATSRPQPQVATARPAAAKRSKNRLLMAGAVLLVAVIGLCAGGLALLNRQPKTPEKQANQPPPESRDGKPDGAGSKDNNIGQKVTQENFDKLTVGMTLGKLQEILGEGRRAAAKDVHVALPANYQEVLPCWSAAWTRAAAEERVQVWQEGEYCILAAFPGVVSAGSKVEVLFHDRAQQPDFKWVLNFPTENAARICRNVAIAQKPADKWTTTPGKVRLGMTLKEMEDILGLGQGAGKEDVNEHASVYGADFGKSRSAAWSKAVKEGRVQVWRGGGFTLLGAFPGAPSAGSKVEILLSSFLTSKDGRTSITMFQVPADKWTATKENFGKLKVGMTLKEVNEILGVGPRITREQLAGGNVYWGRRPLGKLEADEEARKVSWEKAVKEQRVHRWEEIAYKSGILAAFSETPSDDTRAEAFYYFESAGYEHKGSVSGK
jgi:Protein kinase domain